MFECSQIQCDTASNAKAEAFSVAALRFWFICEATDGKAANNEKWEETASRLHASMPQVVNALFDDIGSKSLKAL